MLLTGPAPRARAKKRQGDEGTAPGKARGHGPSSELMKGAGATKPAPSQQKSRRRAQTPKPQRESDWPSNALTGHGIADLLPLLQCNPVANGQQQLFAEQRLADLDDKKASRTCAGRQSAASKQKRPNQRAHGHADESREQLQQQSSSARAAEALCPPSPLAGPSFRPKGEVFEGKGSEQLSQRD